MAKLNIVVTDGFTLNPGDLKWDSITSMGEVTIYERTRPDEVIQRCKDADVVLTNKVAFDRKILSQLPRLKLISVLATGFNIIDTEAARERGVQVCNVPDYGSSSVAQHTFAFILEMATQVGVHSASVHKGDWVNCKDFSYSLTPLIEISDKVLGLVGYGNIGRKVADIGRAFGMQVVYHTPGQKETPDNYVSLDELFEQSDFISLHVPLKADNKEFVNKSLLSKMKKSAFLINTSRGPLINEKDLADALNAGHIAGAGLDVLSVEPPDAENPLLSAKNCFITPHNAWMSKEARVRIIATTVRNIQAFLDGKPVNVVN